MASRNPISRPSRLPLWLGAALALAAGAAGAQEGGSRLARPQTPSAELGPEALDPALSIRSGRPAPRVGAPRPATRVAPALRPPPRAGVAKPVGGLRPALSGLDEPAPPAVAKAPRKRPEEDPYAPLGLRLGGLTVLPAIEQTVGFDTNPNRLSGGAKGSVVHRTEGEVQLRSDWSRHALTGAIRGSYSAYPSVRGANRPEGQGALSLRLDAARDTQVDIDTRFRIDTERPGSPELGVAVTERPIVASVGASAGVTQRFNRLSVGLRGSVDRTEFEDASVGGGRRIDQSDRNVTQTALRLRGSYELTPGLIPFVEASVDARKHDEEVDRAGFRRDSTGVSGRVGTTLEFTRTLTGEASAGYQVRDYEDTRLRELRGPVGEAAIVWAATPLTTVRLRGAATLEETSIPDASGALATQATLEVKHDLLRNLSLTASATAAETEYRGVRLKEELLSGTLRMDYKLTRSVALRASFTHERLTSTSPGSDYTANVYLVGLRFQP